ncbi:hypothetical protein NDU88_004964 [Pleurodeles waltl]|uniref:Uncharacterized protein n=1 Tax=Pleurodeles waltl TaxID=8319 RepID=A0AAV7M7V0_PLEWA|nr:hypothetical protein NDU88_004964 [Pleurodeles waltl]
MCCRGSPEPGPPGCPDLRVPREDRRGPGGLRRGADPGRCTGGGPGPLEVNPSACSGRPRESGTVVRSGAVALRGAPQWGLTLGPIPTEVARGCILVV